MKRIGLILILSCFTPFIAQAEVPEFLESLYIFSTQNLVPADIEGGDCDWAELPLGEPAVAGFHQELFSVHSKKTSGELLKDDLKQVGKLDACVAGTPIPNQERIQTVYDLGAVWLLHINEKVYFVGGHLRFRTPAPGTGAEFPGPGYTLLSGTGTILNPITLDWRGSMTSNAISDPIEIGNGDYEIGSIITVRLYTPNPNAD